MAQPSTLEGGIALLLKLC